MKWFVLGGQESEVCGGGGFDSGCGVISEQLALQLSILI